MTKTFEELIEPHIWFERSDYAKKETLMDKVDVLDLLKQVREATIAEAVEFCVSQDWIKTIDNLKRLPTDRIYEFEKPKE